MKKLFAWGIVVILLAFLSFNFFDKPTIIFVHDHPSHILTLISRIFDWTFTSIIWLPLSSILVLWFIVHSYIVPKHKAVALRNQRGFQVFLALFLSLICSTILKLFFARYRPELFLTQGLYGLHYMKAISGIDSFPSNHATVAFSLATSLYLITRRYAILWFGLAFIVCISRIIYLKHYPSDVLVGAYMAILVTYLVHTFLTRKRKT